MKLTLKFITKYGKQFKYINFTYQEINAILGKNPDIIDYEIEAPFEELLKCDPMID